MWVSLHVCTSRLGLTSAIVCFWVNIDRSGTLFYSAHQCRFEYQWKCEVKYLISVHNKPRFNADLISCLAIFFEQYDSEYGILLIFLQSTLYVYFWRPMVADRSIYISSVRKDMDMALDHIVPESLKWRHTDEVNTRFLHGVPFPFKEWKWCRLMYSHMLESWFNLRCSQGPDDSVSHTKASLIGSSISVPVTKGIHFPALVFRASSSPMDWFWLSGLVNSSH
jgi:thiamine phosphate synthase YjbQ (UPF0047 family)